MSGAASTASIFETLLLVLSPFMPLVLVVALLRQSTRELIIRLAPWAALPALMATGVTSGALLDIPWLFLGAHFGVDEISRVFLFFTSVLWLLSGIYARSYLAEDSRRAQFFGFYLLAMSGNLGLILAQDVLVFYLFFALMSLSSYGLIVHRRDPQSIRAGRVYIYLFVLGEVLLFSGMVVGAWHAGSLDLKQFQEAVQGDMVIALLFLGFGIKAGALPLHFWLPLAHTAAPTPASAVLSGAMINAGLLGWIRFLPMGQVALPEWSLLFIAAGLGAALFGVLVGVFQEQAKTILAYSSISQMGLMTFCVGLGMAAPVLWPLCLSAILIYALHHALAKGALFLGLGIAAASSNPIHRKWVIAGLLLPAAALAGLPFTSGAVAKLGLKSLTHVLPAPWPEWVAVLLSVIAVGTTLLMIRFLYLARPKGTDSPRLQTGLCLPWIVLVTVVVFGTWLWGEANSAALQTLSVSKFWQALWPAGLAVIISWAAWTLRRKTNIKPAFRIPAGDILVAAEWLAGKLGPTWLHSGDRLRQHPGENALDRGGSPAGLGIFDRSGSLENRLRRWQIFGVLFVVMALAIAFILALA